MIINKEFMAFKGWLVMNGTMNRCFSAEGSIEELNEIIIMYETDATRIRSVSNDLIGRAFTFCEQNEKLRPVQLRLINSF